MEETLSSTPPQIRAAAEIAVSKLLPPKSKPVYDKEFNLFKTWCAEKKVVHTTENVLLAYYGEMATLKKASTLWSSYSMLRACLSAYNNLDISKFTKLQAFLKRQSDGYKPKKSKILQQDEIHRFINETDDINYLAIKVILIMGYCGALRRDELTKMAIDDVRFKDGIIYVSVPITKTKSSRLFMITDEVYINLIKKYINLRPDGAPKRFFLTYRNGHCVKSPIGINKIAEVPRTIASYLKLSNPEQYTGHCFRRSSATHLANQGGDLITIKRHGGWKSSAVAEAYIEDSLSKKKEVAEMFTLPQQSTISSYGRPSPSCLNPSENPVPTTSSSDGGVNLHDSTNFHQNLSQNRPGFSLQAHDACNITINNYNNCTFYGQTNKND